MRLQSRLRRLIKRRGYRINEVVRQGLRDLIATVYAENPHVVDEHSDNDSDEMTSIAGTVQHPITCPHCGEPIAIDIDLSGSDQDDVQDCTVCCSPIHITYRIQDGCLADFTSEPY